MQRQPKSPALVGEAPIFCKSPIVDKLLEGSLSEGDTEWCDGEEWYKKEGLVEGGHGQSPEKSGKKRKRLGRQGVV